MPKIRIGILLVAVATFSLGGAFAAQVPSSNTGLSGMVKSSDGEPLEGVALSARAQGRTFTTTLYTHQKW